jgi:hypothetical protein
MRDRGASYACPEAANSASPQVGAHEGQSVSILEKTQTSQPERKCAEFPRFWSAKRLLQYPPLFLPCFIGADKKRGRARCPGSG